MAHDFIVFSFVALTTLLTGRIFYRFNWEILNQLGWPLVLVTLITVLWLQRSAQEVEGTTAKAARWLSVAETSSD